MIITGILQVRNEERSGHLARFLEWNMPLFDHLVAYDDCSTDQTVSMLEKSGADVIKGDFRTFQSELHIKSSLLSRALLCFPDTEWFLWLDADELLLESREKLELLLNESESLGFDGIELPLVNLWRTDYQFRTDSGFNDLTNVRLWKNNQQLKFIIKPGLHHLLHPSGMKRIRHYESLRVLHYGFSSDYNILAKFHAYQKAGQRGRNLWRLVSESGLVVLDISNYAEYLGSRYIEFSKSTKKEFSTGISQLLIDKCRIQETEIYKGKLPVVTLISLIYAGVDWLEFQYGELLKLQSELGPGEVEILFVANDASEEVLDFLRQNLIPFVIAPGKNYDGEWYINSVYRAYNYGVACAQGDYVLLTNSDMSYRPGFLVEMLKHRSLNSYLVGKLIESGRLTPAKSAIKKNLGKKITNFRRRAFYSISGKILKEGKSSGGLFMPVLVSRKAFLEAGGYPEGNIKQGSLESYTHSGDYNVALPGDPLVPGDFAFVKRLEINGWKHETLNSAIAYHFQEGEKSETQTSDSTVVHSGVRIQLTDSRFFKDERYLSARNEIILPRITFVDSMDKMNKEGMYILLEKDDNPFEKPDARKLGNVLACISPSIFVIQNSAIDFNIHAYLVDELIGDNTSKLNRVFEEILASELRRTFLPIEPKPIKLIFTEKIPVPLKRFIKYFARLMR